MKSAHTCRSEWRVTRCAILSRAYVLVAELPVVDRASLARAHDLLDRRERQGARGTHGRAHRTPTCARAVVAHVALHHLIGVAVVFRHAERTRKHAVRAADAALLERALDDAVGRLLDGVGGTHLRADRILAVHAHLRRRLHAVAPLDRFEVDERSPAVRVAFLARLDARLASDAAGVIDEEGELTHRTPPAAGSSLAISPVGSGAFETRTAQILNSGIFEIGSIARIVQLFADRSSGQ
jgi:hypothetical protein